MYMYIVNAITLCTDNRYRHSNLIELMGYCTSPPGLVFQFMQNGSLYDNLHVKVFIQ